MATMSNEVTSADGGWRVLFAFVVKRPAAAEFWRWRGAGRGHFAACVGGRAGVEEGRRKTNGQSG